MASLQYLLQQRQHLIADSSFSPQLYNYRQLAELSPQLDNLIPKDTFAALRRSYLSSDISIILTNTFDANRYKLKLLGLSKQTSFINERAAQLTQTAIRGYERHIAVAGNIGPIGKIVPHADAVNSYAEQAEALARGGVDCFWLEAFASREQAEAAIIGCEIGAPQIPVIVTLSFIAGQHLLDGIIPISAAKTFCVRPTVHAIGADTGSGALDVVHTAGQIALACPNIALVAKMDLSTISAENQPSHTAISNNKSIEAYVNTMLSAANAGIRIIAAGRDATPMHLNAMSIALRKLQREKATHYRVTTTD